MEKFTDGLDKWVQKRGKGKRRKDTLVVEFLAAKKNICDAIDAGYSLITIWEYLKENGQIGSTYETFRRHVHRFIKNEATPKNLIRYSQETRERSPHAAKRKLPGTDGFTFDAKPNKKDLI